MDRATDSLRLRSGTQADLLAVNAVVDAAVLSWKLPERVKRLALPSYRYKPHDLDFLELIVATDSADHIVAVAAIEQADPADAIDGRRTLLLHGIYVTPASQQRGIGRALLNAVADAGRQRGYGNLLVKAQTEAEGFFVAQGLEQLLVTDSDRDYPNRFRKQL